MLRLYLAAARSREVGGLFKMYANGGQRGGTLSLEDFKSFWRDQQQGRQDTGRPGRSKGAGGSKDAGDAAGDDAELEDEATQLFVRAVGGRSATLTVDGFQQLLLSPANCAVDPQRTGTLSDDMSQPLSHYYIASSHNTYVSGNQLSSASSASMYKRVLMMGCRCVEIDCEAASRHCQTIPSFAVAACHRPNRLVRCLQALMAPTASPSFITRIRP